VQSIVEGLLRFNSEQGLHNTLVNFSKLVAEVTAEADHSDIEPNLSVEGDAGQLAQLVLAIFENAKHAVAQGGQVNVSLHRHHRELQLKIKDSGVGISSSIKHRVFDPFFTTRTIGQGVGLGLSLAQGIAKRHSGAITFHSSEGIGTTFLFNCPVLNDAP
jgi:two-component system NtrC family sensor kinase